jgi:phage nucleotide-binding protein
MSMKPKKSSVRTPSKKTGGIEDNIRPVQDVERTASYAIYGRAGSGKTTLASSFPKPLLLLDIRDKGTDSIADVKGVDVLEIDELEDIEDIYYYLRENPKKYKTVVFDTVTEMQKIVMKHVVLSKSKNKRKVDEDRVGDWGTMARKDWGDVAGIMNKWIADFRDLPMEVVFLAQEKVRNEDGDEGDDNQLVPEVGPAVMPSIATTLNAAVNVIGNMFIRMKRSSVVKGAKKSVKEEPVYCLRVGPNPIYTTKLRKPKSAEAPPYVEDPTYKDIIDLVKGNE